jgi:hypothetical protein
MTPFISVLLPTRKRTQLVQTSLATLLDNSAVPGSIEILIAYDEDDNESDVYFQSQQWQDYLARWSAPAQVHRCPNWGYYHLNNYINLLAHASLGEWILFWNDDAVMLTPGWDDAVRKHRDHLGVLHMPCTNVAKHTIFPLIPRTWLDIFPVVSMHASSDSWIQDICKHAAAKLTIPVQVMHDRFSETGNNNDETYQQRRYDKRGWKNAACVAERRRWATHLATVRRTGVYEPMLGPFPNLQNSNDS